MYPILMFPAGIPYEMVCADTIALIGFIPTSAVRSMFTEAGKRELAEYNKIVVAQVYGYITDAITRDHFQRGVDVHLRDETRHIHPFVLTGERALGGPSDLPESNQREKGTAILHSLPRLP